MGELISVMHWGTTDIRDIRDNTNTGELFWLLSDTNEDFIILQGSPLCSAVWNF